MYTQHIFKAALLLSLFIFLILHGCAADSGCPNVCLCLDDNSRVDCSSKKLRTAPISYPKQTKFLYLDDNALTEFPDLSELHQLEVLSISKNKIVYVEENRTIHLLKLKELNLAHNMIKRLPSSMFTSENQMEKLDLSYNMLSSINILASQFPMLQELNLQHNQIKSLDTIRNNKMPKLKILRAGFNRIEHLISKLDTNWDNPAFPALTVLELNNNKIRTISMFLTRFKYLKKLVLSYNKLANVIPASFLRNDHLDELYLDHNRLTRVTNIWFTYKQKLKHLDLSSNRIRHIDFEAFSGAKDIKYIDLSNNNLESIEKEMFLKLQHLFHLNIHNNKINYISEHGFVGLQTLIYLNLSKNLISIGEKEFDTAFLPLTSLKILDLNRNNILLIPTGAFRGLSNLITLYLKDNDIKVIERYAFTQLKSLSSLYFETVSLTCDCSIKWFRNWMKSKSFGDTVKGVCSSPAWVKNKNVANVLNNELVCVQDAKRTTRPKVTEHPQPKYVLLHSNTSIQCKTTSSADSEMKIYWYRDSVIMDGKKVSTSTVLMDQKKVSTSKQTLIGSHLYERVSTLVLDHVSFDDVGKYWCHVSNIYGSDWSVAVNLTVVVAPTLSPDLKKEVIARSGENIIIPCVAGGIPPPAVFFTKEYDGLPFYAVEDKRIKFHNPEFGIQNLKIEDSGLYSCSARSFVGTANATMRLTVIEKPKFVRPLHSKSVPSGTTAVIDCIISGNPRPKVTWYKDGIQLIPGSSAMMKLSNQLLVIVSFNYQDEGIYTCQASNRLGMARQTAHLTVGSGNTADGENSSKLPSHVFIGVIVITVIAVTILTSLVWISLICFCRKKRRERAAKRQNQNSEDSLLSELPKDYVLRCNGMLVNIKKSNNMLIDSLDPLIEDPHANYVKDENNESDYSTLTSTLDHTTEDDSGVALIYPKYLNDRPIRCYSSDIIDGSLPRKGRIKDNKKESKHYNERHRTLRQLAADVPAASSINCSVNTSSLQHENNLHPNPLNNSNNDEQIKIMDYDPTRLKICSSSKATRKRPGLASYLHDDYHTYVTSSSGIESGGSSSSETISLNEDMMTVLTEDDNVTLENETISIKV